MGGFEYQTLGDTKWLIFIDSFVSRDSDWDDRIAAYLPLWLVNTEEKRCVINWQLI